MAIRGVSLLTATTIVAEIGDLRRFVSAPQLMAYLGVVPSEHSSGGKKSRGGITKTGNGYVRRVLVEAAWTYRHPARKTATLQKRAQNAPEAVQKIAGNGQKRMSGHYTFAAFAAGREWQVTGSLFGYQSPGGHRLRVCNHSSRKAFRNPVLIALRLKT
jgi:hypothetical protein